MAVLQLDFLAPIPVGHDVTLLPIEIAYQDDEGNVVNWLPTRLVALTDLVTGIVYCEAELSSWIEPTTPTIRPHGRYRLSPTAAPKVVRVTGCVVHTGASETRNRMGTRLFYEDETGQGPYR